MKLEAAARELTIHQPSLTYFDALEILLEAYQRFLPAKRYGSTLKTCLKIEWGILLRADEDELQVRVNRFREGK